jgi:crotonobetainyl-CoA:carnitine CoA-transferase CaiB-like acyl-CoA transferase
VAVAAWIGARGREEVLAAFEAADAAAAPVYDARDIVADPHFLETGTLAAVEDERLGTVRMPGMITHLSDTPGTIAFPGGTHGQHTEAVLDEAGLSSDDIAALREQGAV